VCLKGDVKFKESVILKFSNNSYIIFDSLKARAIEFRKLLPKNYWSDGVRVTRLDKNPNENGQIWFQRLYVQEDGKGNIRILASSKVLFEETDATKIHRKW
jgi:hypothetical protein